MAALLKLSGKRAVTSREFHDDAKDAIEDEISALDTQIATAMTNIASQINKKYVELIPDLVTSNKLLDTIRSACETANNSIASVDENLKSLEKDVELHKTAVEKFESAKDFKSRLSSLEEMESILCQLWYSSNEDNALINARLIRELENKLINILQDDKADDRPFVEQITPALKKEIVTLRQGLTYMLNVFWDETFSLRELNDKVILQLPASSSATVNEKLSAMDELNSLDAKVSKLASALMYHFCWKIISAKEPTEVVSYRSASGKNEYVVQKIAKSVDREGMERPDPEKVFCAMLELFKNIGKVVGAITVSEKSMARLIGNKISNEIVEILVHKCLTPAVPYDSKDMPAFEALLTSTDEFTEEMKKLGFFTDETQSFKKFAENYESTFINRRCAKIVQEARALIEGPLTEFVTVGNDMSTEVETVEEFYKLGLNKITEGELIEKEHYPKMLQLLRCQISKTAISFADLIVRTLNDAAAAESASAMAKILQTSRNIVELYILTAPRVHKSEISSVPLLAAIFYNNCYYICHRLMNITVEVLPKMQNAVQSKKLFISFTDFIPNLRQLAAESMEEQLAQCRRQISTIMADDKIFIGLNDVSQYEKCMKCLDGCLMQLEQISGIWKNVLTDTIYGNCMSNIVTFFFNSIMKMILCTVDIRADDAELTVLALKRVLKKSELLFSIDDPKHSSIHRYVESPYFRMKELIFCLDSSLQNIYDRWCDGKGPLAQWLRANEVRHLVRALFQNTGKRAYVLSKIN